MPPAVSSDEPRDVLGAGSVGEATGSGMVILRNAVRTEQLLHDAAQLRSGASWIMQRLRHRLLQKGVSPIG
jgi:hypothetical protein